MALTTKIFFVNILISVSPFCFYAQTTDDKSWQSDMHKPDANFYEIRDKAHRYFDAKDKADTAKNKAEEENDELMNFARWEWFWKNRAGNPNSKTGSFNEASQALYNYMKQNT